MKLLVPGRARIIGMCRPRLTFSTHIL